PTEFLIEPYLYGACSVFQQSTFFPRELFRTVEGFRECNRSCWDGELFLSFARHGFRHSTIPDLLAAFRLHDESITGSNRLKQQYRADRRRMFEEHFERRWTTMDSCRAIVWRARKIARRLTIA